MVHYTEESLMQPYVNKGNIRTFSKDVNKLELVWHQDAEDREIEVLEGKGWELQMDNELPFELVKGDRIFIKELEIHRVLKGTTDLKIKINE
jgi:quercetin dioxygenase-like cupin family protein